MGPVRRIFAPGCAKMFDPDEWHKELDAYIDAH